MKKLPTSTQPEVTDQRIYGGGRKPTPIPGASNQPANLPNTKVYGQRKTPTIRVRLKADRTKREMVIPFSEYNPAKHARVD